jgi:transposase-like protein
MAYAKYSNEERIKAIEMLALYSLNEVSKKTGIPKATLSTWKNGGTKESEQLSNDFEQIRTEKKQEFVRSAWNSIGLAQDLIYRRLERARNQEEKLDNLLERVTDEIEESDMTPKEKAQERKKLLGLLSGFKVEDLKELSITLGTLYDKQALASNESTVNESIKIELCGELKDFAK